MASKIYDEWSKKMYNQYCFGVSSDKIPKKGMKNLLFPIN